MVKERKVTVKPFLNPAPPDGVHGLESDGERLWYATGETLIALDPASGDSVREIAVPSGAGTTFDGKLLYQLDGALIRKLDPETGDVVGTIPAPDGGGSGMVWAEGSLWVGRYREQRIHRVDPESGAILATIETRRFVTGVTFLDGALWHGAQPRDDEGDDAPFELHRVDPASGELLERAVVDTAMVSGMTPDGEGGLYCGGGKAGTIQRVTFDDEP